MAAIRSRLLITALLLTGLLGLPLRPSSTPEDSILVTILLIAVAELSHCLTVFLLPHCFPASLPQLSYITVSLPHCLTFLLSHCLSISLSGNHRQLPRPSVRCHYQRSTDAGHTPREDLLRCILSLSQPACSIEVLIRPPQQQSLHHTHVPPQGRLSKHAEEQ